MTLDQIRKTDAAAQDVDWNYDVAFCRNLGLVSPEEQQRLRRARVAIAGMGGVGGFHLVTLARLGIGAFHMADPDHFEVANFNRQRGGLMRNVGRLKTEAMADEARQINPELDLKLFPSAIDEHNVEAFLDGVDIFIDGVDFFCIDARRLLFREARKRGIWALTAGPLGFGTAWLVFDPRGMSFDEYFDLHAGLSRTQQVAAMAVGLCPAATHMPYMDLKYVDLKSGRGPSAGLACHLSGGVAAAQVLKILLQRGKIRAAPWYHQFDAYRQILKRGYLWWGNRHPLQRLKRAVLCRRLEREAVT